jgi:hypothetical protein
VSGLSSLLLLLLAAHSCTYVLYIPSATCRSDLSPSADIISFMLMSAEGSTFDMCRPRRGVDLVRRVSPLSASP